MDQRAGAIVRNAARAIEKYGWIQHADGSPEFGMCIRGAINYIEMEQYLESSDHHGYFGAEDEFSEWMDSIGQYEETRRISSLTTLFNESKLVPIWNDMPERTKEEVLLYMNKFADEVDPQGP